MLYFFNYDISVVLIISPVLCQRTNRVLQK